MNSKTIAELFIAITTEYAFSKKPVYSYKKNDVYEDISFNSLRATVQQLSIALHILGLQKGDKVAIISENRYEWVVSDFAIACLGLVSVPLYTSVTPTQIEFILKDSEAKAVIVSNSLLWSKVSKIVKNCHSVEHYISMNLIDEQEFTLLTFESLLQNAHLTIDKQQNSSEWFEVQCLSVSPNDVLTIIYTSGTTGEPKGVLLSNENILSNIQSILKVIYVTFEDIFLSYLPLAHAYERTTGFYCSFASGATTVFAESIDTVAANIKETNPTILTSVPRLFDKIYTKMEKAFALESDLKQKAIRYSLAVGLQYFKMSQVQKVSLVLELKYGLVNWLLLSKLRSKIGSEIRLFVSGGAALSQKSAEFFLGMGFVILEGYGLTESSPVLCVNRFDNIEIGTVGQPLDGVEIRLSEDGEILARGKNIMLGYYKRNEETKETILDGGWLATGDIGQITERGNLRIIDRKKNILISKGGKNIAPNPIEQLISESPLIDQIILIGDNQEYCVALIVPESSELKRIAEILGLANESMETLLVNAEILRHFKQEIDLRQKNFAKYERVRKFALLPVLFSIDSGELTPKLSIKRSVVEKKYKHIIDTLYQ